MTRGRRPDLPGLQELKGHPGKRKKRAAAGEAIEAAELGDGVPAMVKAGDARAIWRKLAPELHRLKFLRATDEIAFARYCNNLARWIQIDRQLATGKVVYWTDSAHGKMKRIDPRFIVLRHIEKGLVEAEDRFGLNPAARQRIMLQISSTSATLPFNDKPPAGAAGEPPAEQPTTGDAPERRPIGFLN